MSRNRKWVWFRGEGFTNLCSDQAYERKSVLRLSSTPRSEVESYTAHRLWPGRSATAWRNDQWSTRVLLPRVENDEIEELDQAS